MRRPCDALVQARQTLDEFQNRIEKSVRNRIDNEKQRLHSLANQLNALSHKSILQRGFSIVRDKKSKNLIRSIADLQIEQEVDLEHMDGRSEAKINAVFDK